MLVRETLVTLDVVLQGLESLKTISPSFKELLLYGHYPLVHEFCTRQLIRLARLSRQDVGDVLNEIGAPSLLQLISRAAPEVPAERELKERAIELFDELSSSSRPETTAQLAVSDFLPLLSSSEERVKLAALEILSEMALEKKRALFMFSHDVPQTLFPILLSAKSAPLAAKALQLVARMAVHCALALFSRVPFDELLTFANSQLLPEDGALLASSPELRWPMWRDMTSLLLHLLPGIFNTEDLSTNRTHLMRVIDVAIDLVPAHSTAGPVGADVSNTAIKILSNAWQGSASARSAEFRAHMIASDLASVLLEASLSPAVHDSSLGFLAEMCAPGVHRSSALVDTEALLFDFLAAFLSRSEPTKRDQASAVLKDLGFDVEQQTAGDSWTLSRRKLKPALPMVDGSASSAADNEDEDDGACSVCLDAAADTVFYRCGHLVTCFACATMIRDSARPECPICRERIEDIVKAFF